MFPCQIPTLIFRHRQDMQVAVGHRILNYCFFNVSKMFIQPQSFVVRTRYQTYQLFHLQFLKGVVESVPQKLWCNLPINRKMDAD